MELKYIMENIIREFDYCIKPYAELLKELEDLKSIYGNDVIISYLTKQQLIDDIIIKFFNIKNAASIDVIEHRIKLSNVSLKYNVASVLNHEYMHQILFNLSVGNLHYDNLYIKNEFI